MPVTASNDSTQLHGTKVTIMRARTLALRIAVAGAALLLTATGAMAVNSAAGSGGTENERARTGSQAGHRPGHGGHAGHHGKVVKVILRGVDGHSVGRVSLRQSGELVVVRGWARSLTPGFHGFHIHTTGLCEADAPAGPFTTAGGHYTGGDTTHGDHAGDMPSLLVTENGWAYLTFVTDRFTVADLRDADGSAVMVHEGRDNFANIPTRYVSGGVPGPDAITLATGDAGTRAACGVID
jgi:Cu-Zn family superoxide dismutase